MNCKTCRIDSRSFEFNIIRVRGLNKPFTRSGIVFGNILQIVDSSIGIISFEHYCSNFGSEYIQRDLHKFFQYDEIIGDFRSGFKLKKFKFEIGRSMRISKPFTRSGKVFNDILKIIDSTIVIMTFGYFDSSISQEILMKDLEKFEKYIAKFGTNFLEKDVDDNKKN